MSNFLHHRVVACVEMDAYLYGDIKNGAEAEIYPKRETKSLL
jgi:hypothetical protein